MSNTTQLAAKVGSAIAVLAFVIGVRLILDRAEPAPGGPREPGQSERRAAPAQGSSTISQAGSSSVIPTNRPPRTNAMPARSAQMSAKYARAHHYTDQIKYTYQALMETLTTFDGSYYEPQHSLILADKAKFCVKRENIMTRLALRSNTMSPMARSAAEAGSKSQPYYSTWLLYDDTSPDIEWEFTPAATGLGPRTATGQTLTTMRVGGQASCSIPVPSVEHLLAVAAARDGFDAIARRYGLPDHVRDDLASRTSPYEKPVGALTTMQWILGKEADSAHRVGVGKVANYECTIYEHRRASPGYHGVVHRRRIWTDGRTTDLATPITRNSYVLDTRLWVEKRTGLVLKKESRLVEGSTYYPVRRGDFEVKELKFFDSLPADLFEIPAGANVRVTALMLDLGVKLPQGVIQTPDLTDNGLPSCGVGFAEPTRRSPAPPSRGADRSRRTGLPPS